MGKLSLSVDSLSIQSFQTSDEDARGEVPFSPTVGSTYCSCPNLCKPHD